MSSDTATHHPPLQQPLPPATAARQPRPGACRPPLRPGHPPPRSRICTNYGLLRERCFNRLKQWRGIATRHDKTAQSLEAAVALASHLMWARNLTTEPRGTAV